MQDEAMSFEEISMLDEARCLWRFLILSTAFSQILFHQSLSPFRKCLFPYTIYKIDNYHKKVANILKASRKRSSFFSFSRHSPSLHFPPKLELENMSLTFIERYDQETERSQTVRNWRNGQTIGGLCMYNLCSDPPLIIRRSPCRKSMNESRITVGDRE